MKPTETQKEVLANLYKIFGEGTDECYSVTPTQNTCVFSSVVLELTAIKFELYITDGGNVSVRKIFCPTGPHKRNVQAIIKRQLEEGGIW